jgi:hypothetical protein
MLEIKGKLEQYPSCREEGVQGSKFPLIIKMAVKNIGNL